MTEDVRYATSVGEVEIAYAISGSGPVDLVYVAGFISHLDLSREVSAMAALRTRLDRFGRVLAFDKRGTGLSGRDLGFGSIAERMDDIRAVMDAAGWERAHLVGVSEGGPLSLLFAATYPERVESLALYGTFACLAPPADRDTASFDIERFLNFVERSWGTGRVLAGFVHAPFDADALAVVARYERACCSPRLAAAILRRNFEIDIREALPSIAIPVLVVHRTDDPIVGVERGRELARGLTNATYVELDGDFHCGWDAGEWAPVLDVIEDFLGGTAGIPTEIDRLLATVLFTDIVGSTELATELGDRAWHDVLDLHDSETGRLVTRFGGRVVKHTGDGTLATFDGPARAVHCAKAIRDTLAVSNLPLRSGLHTCEIDSRGEDIGGIGVHIAARIAARARPGEVLVSRTVRDLVVGSDLSFEDCGEHTLKGVAEPWQIYAARN